jgi:type VI secretion system VasD/TssJ family lipoprotein
MTNYLKAVSLFLFLLICSSCASGTKPTPWREKSMDLTFKGDPQLNLYQNSSHALYLCVCQLKDPNAFNQLVDEREGMEKILSECNRFDASVAYAKRYVVQPGQTVTDFQDHAEGGRFMGIVAGYYNMKKEHVVRLFPISKSLSMVVDLGPRGILNIREK